MDDTEIHFVTYDPDAIWSEMQMAYVEAGGDPLYPGDEKEMLLRSVQADIVSVFAGVDNALRMQTLRYATGDYLDLLGESRGCERLEAEAATCIVSITWKWPSGGESGSITIPAGTLLTADGSVYFSLDDSLTYSSGTGNTVFKNATCTVTGAAGNGLAGETDLNFADEKYSYVTAIKVAYTGSAGGRDAETDDDYRTRLQTCLNGTVTVGTKSQYEQAALDYDDRITQACATYSSATGKAVISIVCEDPDDETDCAVALQTYIESEGKTALGIAVGVIPASAKEYTLVLTVNAGSLTSTDVQDVIDEYQEWQDNILGRSFTPENLVAMLYKAGSGAVTIGSGSSFDGGSAAYTVIAENERCQGTVTFTLV